MESGNPSSTKESTLAYSESNFTEVICLQVPPLINSKGLWVRFDDPNWWLKDSLPLLELQFLLFGLSLAITHLLLKRSGASKISSQILIGLIFGYSWKQLDEEKVKLFYVPNQDVLGLLADFGYTLYLFLSAVKIDVSMTIRTGKKALIIGIPALLVPLIGGTFAQTLLDDGLSEADLSTLPLLISFHGITSFPVIASLLSDLRIVNSELGRLGLSSALVSDLLSLSIMVAASQAKRYHDFPSLASFELGALILLFVVVLFVFRPAMLWIIRQTPEGMPVRPSHVQAVIFLALFTTAMANLTGQASIMGPYILGLAVPDGAPLGSTLVDKIECLVSDVFMPILVATCALRADLSQISASFEAAFTQLNIVLILVAFVVKVVSCFLSARYCRLPFKDSLALALIMSNKGAVELVLYTMARDYHSIDDGLFGCCTLAILFVATVVPIAVKCLYDPSRKYAGYQNRNIMHLNPSSDELRLLACVHRNENINGIIHLLNLSCPSAENPLAIHIFHLIELSGRTTPVFISHKFHNKALKERSYSRHIIHSFDQFERDNDGMVYVECFTAISPNRFMHDDICTLALDKITSLIILPFHRTWMGDGCVYDDDNMIRTLNCSVLERAPCSIGIFADRGRLGSIATTATPRMRCKYSVCVIFLGGKDDREAVSYAKRMTRESRVELTVLRLRASAAEEHGPKENNWEHLLDSEVLRDFRSKCLGDGRVMYKEDVCRDGQQTAFILRKIVNKFDLMIVGRRNGLKSSQTDGLDEWNEFPELGVLGDLIASTDINSRASLLVIQQQKIMIQQS